MSAEHEKRWGAGVLKSRGWTEELITSLLGAPHYQYFHGHRTRTWAVSDVRTAEQSEEFALRHTEPAQRPEAMHNDDFSGGRADFEAAAELLEDTWKTAVLPEGRTALLALRYHQALQQQLRAPGILPRGRAGQFIGDIDRFLYLEHKESRTPLSSVLRRLITAGAWIGQNPDSAPVNRLREHYALVLYTVSERNLRIFTAAQSEADADALLQEGSFPLSELLAHPLSYLYSVCYVPRAIRSSLKLLVALHPKDEYPEARAMERHFIIHIGGTNTGKTYAGFQRLKRASTGVYLAPLRLLALEAQELLLDAGVNCSLTTGEEEDCREGDTHVAATAEKLDISRRYEVAVVDECQMIADKERGFAWTRAILGVLAPEIHLCAAPEAKDLLIRIIESAGDTWEVAEHLRKTPLICMNHTIDYSDVQPGDALITFSKVGVLSVAEDLRARGKEPAIIYGALPYSTRRKQMEGFLSGDMKYVVSTDAIGMGLNLPIRRVIFMDTQKFDGTERRDLRPEEIRQIAGRAGRYGIYDKGYVGATEDIDFIRAGLEAEVPSLREAVAGFSELVLQVDFDLLEVLTEWSKMPTPAPFVKLNVDRYIRLIQRLRAAGFSLPKEQELRCGNIPFDEEDPELMDLFYSFLRCVLADDPLRQPELPEKNTAHTLPELEQHCRRLDLYFSFSKAFGCPIDRQALFDTREQVADDINRILLYNLKNNIRFCARCGAALPLHQSGRLCSRCYRTAGSFRSRGHRGR